MRKLIYYVAATLDGFIAHSDGSVGGFLEEGPHVADYLKSLQDFDTVIMGRHTYEFGYDYGLQPGQPAYPHMKHYIFSKTMQLDTLHDQVEIVKADELATVQRLKVETGTPIYLCGGGAFAGFLLEQELIDELIVKVNPVVFGSGIPLFGITTEKQVALELYNSKSYENGVFFLYYRLKYG